MRGGGWPIIIEYKLTHRLREFVSKTSASALSADDGRGGGGRDVSLSGLLKAATYFTWHMLARFRNWFLLPSSRKGPKTEIGRVNWEGVQVN